MYHKPSKIATNAEENKWELGAWVKYNDVVMSRAEANPKVNGTQLTCIS